MAFCADCTYLNLNSEYGSNDGRFWCDAKLEWHYANEIACHRYCQDYNRSDSVSNSYKEYSEKSQNSGGCYITTIMCEILELGDNNYYLNQLRNFRKYYLQNSDKYKLILATYDIIGPKIAYSLSIDSRKYEIANNLFNLGIKKIVDLIKKGKYTEAIKLYYDMTLLLQKGYNIVETVTNEQINSIDITKSGHGKFVKKI